MRAADLSGMRFGRAEAVRFVRTDGQKRIWMARCECGTEFETRGESLVSGNTTSCGCARRDAASGMNRSHGHAGKKSRTPEYRTWKAILGRCLCRTNSAYTRYGAIGVTVCDAWRWSFPEFLLSVGPKPGPGFSIDRINPFGNYEPGNVRWATAREQANNRRANWLAKEVAI